jgi:nucleotide-binding universal stress UspA family protein
MKNMENIVVPIDFYQHTEGLLEFAEEIAKKLGGRVTFLHVAERIATESNYFDVYPPSFAAVNAELLEQARTKMAELVEKHQASCAGCQGVVLEGDVADAIVDYVKKNGADLVIIGTHGYRGIQKILLGSVADRVLKRAACPILVFNPYKGESA